LLVPPRIITHLTGICSGIAFLDARFARIGGLGQIMRPQQAAVLERTLTRARLLDP